MAETGKPASNPLGSLALERSSAFRRVWRAFAMAWHWNRYDLFISYRRSDGSDYARALCVALESTQFSCFLDRERLSAGTSLRADLVAALKDSAVLIVVASPEAHRSAYIERELDVFAALNRTIIPINVESGLQLLGHKVFVERDILHIDEQREAFLAGVPSAETLRGIQDAFRVVRRQVRFLVMTTATALAVGLTLALVGIYAADQAAIAGEATQRQKIETERADSASRAARAQTRIADSLSRVADSSSRAAIREQQRARSSRLLSDAYDVRRRFEQLESREYDPRRLPLLIRLALESQETWPNDYATELLRDLVRRTPKPVGTWRAPSALAAIGVSWRDTSVVIVSSAGSIWRWWWMRQATPSLVATLPRGFSVLSASVDRSGNEIAIGCSNGLLVVSQKEGTMKIRHSLEGRRIEAVSYRGVFAEQLVALSEQSLHVSEAPDGEWRSIPLRGSFRRLLPSWVARDTVIVQSDGGHFQEVGLRGGGRVDSMRVDFIQAMGFVEPSPGYVVGTDVRWGLTFQKIGSDDRPFPRIKFPGQLMGRSAVCHNYLAIATNHKEGGQVVYMVHYPNGTEMGKGLSLEQIEELAWSGDCAFLILRTSRGIVKVWESGLDPRENSGFRTMSKRDANGDGLLRAARDRIPRSITRSESLQFLRPDSKRR
jgi:hypothetical protein